MTLKVEIDDKELRGFEHLEVEAGPPQGRREPDCEPTGPVTVRLRRSATVEGSLAGYGALTNLDGSVRKVALSIQVYDTRNAVSHSFYVNDAYLESWELVEDRTDPVRAGAAQEEWVIRAGEVAYEAGGGKAQFDWPDGLVNE